MRLYELRHYRRHVYLQTPGTAGARWESVQSSARNINLTHHLIHFRAIPPSDSPKRTFITMYTFPHLWEIFTVSPKARRPYLHCAPLFIARRPNNY